MAADVQSGSASKYNQTLSWFNASVGGPVIKNKLFFYGSYYRPERSRDNRSNLYGELPDYNSTRNEGFGKLTFTPTSQILLNGSYRYSHRLDKSDLFGQASAATTGTGYESQQKHPDGGRLVGHQLAQLRVVQVHELREPERRPAGLHRQRQRQHRDRHAARPRQPRQDRAADRAVAAHRPGRGERVLPAVHRPVRLRLERRQDGRRHRRLRHAVRQRRLLPHGLAGRLQRELRVRRSATTSTSATSSPRTRRTCSGVRTAGARSPIPGGRTGAGFAPPQRRAAVVLHGGVPAADDRRRAADHTRRTSRRASR